VLPLDSTLRRLSGSPGCDRGSVEAIEQWTQFTETTGKKNEMSDYKKILIVNLGSTSTKVGVYEGISWSDSWLVNESVGHSAED
jgi:hypothetical protein